MAMCGLFVFILLVIANFYGGNSQRLDGPFCHHDADGNVIWCEKSRRSLNKDSSSGIAHGEDADILEHPYMLALEIDGFGICGASIIGSRWAVTAAHCVQYVDVKRVQLRALSNERHREGITFEVSEAIPHPEYDSLTLENDIELLRVTNPFLETDSRLAAINLPQQDEELPVGTMVTVLGWGKTEDGEESDHLQRIEIPIVPFERCASRIGDVNSDLMICAGEEGEGHLSVDPGHLPTRLDLQISLLISHIPIPLSHLNPHPGVERSYPVYGGKSFCRGDSGGPAVFDNTLYGIVSFTRKKFGCPKDLMGFTKVATYREWIEEIQE